MSDSNPDQIVDDAATAIRNVAVPSGPPVHVIENVKRAELTAPSSHRPWFFAALTTAAAVILATGLFTLPKFGGVGSDVAFADVVRELKKVPTVTYRQVVREKGEEDDVSRVTISMDGKFSRDEALDNADKVVQIAIYNAGRMLNYGFEEKKASLHDYTTDDGLPHTLADQHTLADLLKIDPAKANSLGEREFDGKRLTGFHVNRDYDKRTLRSVDVWVDPKSKLPVRVEQITSYRYPNEAQSAAIAEGKGTNKPGLTLEEVEKEMDLWPMVTHTIIMTEIVWRVPVDESTFSLEPPKGYELNVIKLQQ